MSKSFNILILFETSGALSIPCRNAGFNVTTIDILPHQVCNETHIQHDIFNLDTLNLDYSKYDMLFMFFPCTYFSKAGLHWLHKQSGRYDLQSKYLDLFKKLFNLPIPFIFAENPRGSALNKLFRPCDFSFDYEYFSDFKKPESIWCNISVPPLIPVISKSNKKYGSFITNLSYRKGLYNPRDFTPIEFGYAFVSQIIDFLRRKYNV